MISCVRILTSHVKFPSVNLCDLFTLQSKQQLLSFNLIFRPWNLVMHCYIGTNIGSQNEHNYCKSDPILLLWFVHFLCQLLKSFLRF